MLHLGTKLPKGVQSEARGNNADRSSVFGCFGKLSRLSGSIIVGPTLAARVPDLFTVGHHFCNDLYLGDSYDLSDLIGLFAETVGALPRSLHPDGG